MPRSKNKERLTFTELSFLGCITVFVMGRDGVLRISACKTDYGNQENMISLVLHSHVAIRPEWNYKKQQGRCAIQKKRGGGYSQSSEARFLNSSMSGTGFYKCRLDGGEPTAFHGQMDRSLLSGRALCPFSSSPQCPSFGQGCRQTKTIITK